MKRNETVEKFIVVRVKVLRDESTVAHTLQACVAEKELLKIAIKNGVKSLTIQWDDHSTEFDIASVVDYFANHALNWEFFE